MKRPRTWWLALVVCIAIPEAAHAGIRPSFMSDYSSWHATDVVVVDPSGKVMDTWKGDLKTGEQLPIDEFKLPKDLTVRFLLPARPEEPPRVISGKRSVLFLVRERGSDEHLVWKPASLFGGMQVSVAWLDKGRTYAFVQLMNPGPSVLTDLDVSEAEFRQQVKRTAAVQSDLQEFAAIKDRGKRAQRLVEYLDHPNRYCRKQVIEMIGACHYDALPVLRKLLADTEKLSIHPQVMVALEEAGRHRVHSDLLKVVEEELTYWKKVAPTLEQWWGHEPMASHFARLHTALQLLARAYSIRQDVTVVTSLRDFWESQPNLRAVGGGSMDSHGFYSERRPIIDAANAVLAKREESIDKLGK